MIRYNKDFTANSRVSDIVSLKVAEPVLFISLALSQN